MATRTPGLEELVDEAESLAMSAPDEARQRLETVCGFEGVEPSTVARAHYLLARICLNEGSPESAIEHIDAARIHWIEAGQTLAALRSDLGRMNVLDDLGMHRQAISVGRQLLATLEAIGPGASDDIEDVAWLEAAASENLAVAHGYLGEHAQALDSHRRTERIYAELDLPDDVARSMANQGVELLELGRLDEALERLSRAVARFAQTNDHLSEGRALAFAARAQLRNGRITDARATVSHAIARLDKMQHSPSWAQAHLELAEVYCTLGLLDEAERAQTDVVESFDSDARSPERFLGLLNRGQTRLAAGRTHEAASDLRNAADGYVELGDSVGQARALTALSRATEGVESLASARHALALLDNSHPADLAEALIRTAECEFDGDAAAAALEAARALVAGLSMPGLEWQLRVCAGRLARARGQLELALEEFEAAHTITRTQRANLTFEFHRVSFLAARAEVVRELVAGLLDAGDKARALDIIATERSQTLVDRLHGRVDAAAAHHSPDLDEIYSSLLLADGRASEQIARAARSLERLEPNATTSFSEQPTTGATVPEVVFQCVSGTVHAFVGDNGEVRSIGAAPVGAVVQELERLDAVRRRSLSTVFGDRHRNHNTTAASDSLARLRGMLIEPLAELFDGRLPTEIQIVPDPVVSAVPFAALGDLPSIDSEHVVVSISPGVGVGGLLRRRARSLGSTLVAATEDSLAPEMICEARSIGDAGIEPLALIGSDATADAVLSQLGDHDIVHLACHGLFRLDNPWFSALRLADRWITAAELGGADLDGQLVVLSACSSGMQTPLGAGHELIGIPHAVLAAGASAVVVNNWQAEDASSAVLMTEFHRFLAAGDTTAVALAKARRVVRQTQPEVHRWANPTLIGAHDQRVRTA